MSNKALTPTNPEGIGHRMAPNLSDAISGPRNEGSQIKTQAPGPNQDTGLPSPSTAHGTRWRRRCVAALAAAAPGPLRSALTCFHAPASAIENRRSIFAPFMVPCNCMAPRRLTGLGRVQVVACHVRAAEEVHPLVSSATWHREGEP